MIGEYEMMMVIRMFCLIDASYDEVMWVIMTVKARR
jgi:hypothetical protein